MRRAGRLLREGCDLGRLARVLHQSRLTGLSSPRLSSIPSARLSLICSAATVTAVALEFVCCDAVPSCWLAVESPCDESFGAVEIPVDFSDDSGEVVDHLVNDLGKFADFIFGSAIEAAGQIAICTLPEERRLSLADGRRCRFRFANASSPATPRHTSITAYVKIMRF